VQLTFYVRGAAPGDPAAAARRDVSRRNDERGEGSLERIDAPLPARGSLAPLLHAFGLLSGDDLQQLTTEETSGALPQLEKPSSILKRLVC